MLRVDTPQQPFASRPAFTNFPTAGLVLFALLATAPTRALAQQDLFDAEAPLALTLEAGLKPIFNDTRDDREDRPARLWYRTETGDTVSFDLGVRTRGFFRRKYLDCDVPPLRLNFKKSQTPGTYFAGQDKLKLVTHCKDRNEAYEQYTLQEYLLYKLFNQLTDSSFRVRLVRMTYVDTRSKRRTATHYGFLIEDEDRIAERLGGRRLESGVIHQEATDRAQATRLSVFQYMIGNTDWTMPTHHNIKFVLADPLQPPLAIPYDFDMAGLINAPYAAPDPQLGIRSVRERLFRGYCRTENEFDAVFADFNAQREAIVALFRDFSLLEEKYRDRALDYLESFYETINEPRSVKHEFLAVCLSR